jgi:hypothetical protein
MAQDYGKVFDDIADWAKGRITSYAAAGKATFDKVADGDYSGTDLTDDLSNAVARIAEDISSFMRIFPGMEPSGGPDDT